MTDVEWREIVGRVDAIEDEIERLVRLLDGEGSIAPGVVGILRRQEDQIHKLSSRTEQLELTIQRAKWTFSGAAAVGGALGGGIVYLITQLVQGSLPT